MRTISELKNTWIIDEKAFLEKELGGLQSFVKEVLECEELFNLKQGNETTRIEKRKNEFMYWFSENWTFNKRYFVIIN